MTLWSEFTADIRSCVQGPVNIQHLMFGQFVVLQYLESLPGLTQWAGKRAYCDALKAQVLI